ncbi:MAG: HEAT repeat domain-containing protein, partial [Anaerolineae bacterium]|nr:HEAT repeat domain-containing protein [Anaerolineae bacterium]
PRAVPGLLEALRDADVRRAAAEALGRIGDPRAVPGLLKALRDADAEVRWAAAEALGRVGAPAVPGLLEVLRDADAGVRRAAAEALGRIGDPQAIPGLLEALRDADPRVRRAAAEALGRIGAPALPSLLEALRDADWWVRRAAAKALGEIARALKPATEEKARWEQAALLHRVARALYRARRRVDADVIYDALRATLEKLEALTVRYRDPFAPLPAPPLVRVARTAGWVLAGGLLLAALALLGVLSGAAGDLLQEQAQALLRAYPAWVWALLVALLAALAGGLSWALDRLRKG